MCEQGEKCEVGWCDQGSDCSWLPPWPCRSKLESELLHGRKRFRSREVMMIHRGSNLT